MTRHDLPGGFAVVVPDGHDLVVVDAGAAQVAWFDFDGELVGGLDADGQPDGSVFGPTDAIDDLLADLHDSGASVTRDTIAVADGVEFDLDARLWASADAPAAVTVRGLRLDVDGARPLLVHGVGLGDITSDLDTARARWRPLIDTISVATAGTAQVVASEILSVRWWDAQTAAALVELAEATDAWGCDPDDPVPGVEVSLASVDSELFGGIETAVGDTIVPVLRTHWPEFAWCGLHDAFVIRYDAAGGDVELGLHHDVAQISASMRLVDGYEGGALEFPRQGWDNAAVPVGSLTVWPSLVTHPHRGAPVTRGRKYGLTLWFRLPE